MSHRAIWVSVLVVLVSLVGPRMARGQYLMIPDSGTGDRIMLFNETDGSLVDQNWITDAGAVGWAFTTPREAMQVGNEIWVSDQLFDAIIRFDLNRNFLSTITAHPTGGTLDNLRGLGFDGTTVYLCNGPLGTTGAPKRGVAMYDTSGNPTGFFNIAGSLFDAEPFQGDLLISDSDTDDVNRHKTDGTFVGVFANDLTFPQQVARQPDGSVIVMASIAANGVEGLWHLNSDGTVRAFVDTEPIEEQVPQGGWQLLDGGYILGTSAGVYKATSNGSGGWNFNLVVGGVNGQYISPLVIPEPAGIALLTSAACVLGLRRRR